MAHHNTVLSQILKLVPRHEFRSLAQTVDSGPPLRAISRWDQFVALLTGQLSGRRSLRDVIANLGAQSDRLFHLGCRLPSRSTLARVNQSRSHELYQRLFGLLYQRCAASAPRHGFRFKNKLFSLDASLIDLSLRIFPWAEFNRSKSAIKLHLGLDHDGYIPAVAALTDPKCGDLEVARTLRFKPGSIVVMDKGYIDYEWWQTLDSQRVYFVSRPRKRTQCVVVEQRPFEANGAVLNDEVIELTGRKPQLIGMPRLRRITYRCPETEKVYQFVTNHFELDAQTIADLYKSRWQVELFFKWIKQNLKIQTFLGTSRNAILTQIWIALCAYLILAYLKFSAQLDASLQEIARLLQLNLFMRRPLIPLLRGDPPDTSPTPQLAIAL